MYEDLLTARVRPQQTRDVGPVLVRYWVDAIDGGPKLNQHQVFMLIEISKIQFIGTQEVKSFKKNTWT